ncbi:hypothetical protein SAMN05216174_11695 [Actinokineospora iranica]|uniref:Beta-lactamase class A n=2 Tax=Actinokineospora iranica TaxID=1271860 RepID=A0A1G6X3Z4_9PSEU|nr:hypothetical protein SAMN05216174_11695 [Actinokineospora iranica]
MRHHRSGASLALLILFAVAATGCASPPRTVALPATPALESIVESPTTSPTPEPEPSQPPTPPPTRAPGKPPKTARPDALTAAVRAVQGSATVGALVIDRESGGEVLAVQPDRGFRSASLVKLLMAIDALGRGADTRTRERIEVMLRLSDDDVADALWVQGGGAALVTRTARAIGLTGARPPAIPGRWGDVLLTPRDIGRIYLHVLNRLPAADRDLIVAALAAAPRQAADGFDQHFGIPDGVTAQWAVKQGWSNSKSDIVLHSTGLVGPRWRYVVVLLTEHPLSVRWKTAAHSVTAGAETLNRLFT